MAGRLPARRSGRLAAAGPPRQRAAPLPRRTRGLHRRAGPTQASPECGRHPPASRKHRQGHGWPWPAYRTVARIVTDLDPALVTLGLEGTKKYRETYDLVYRREAKAPNEIWQADHTELDIWVLDDKGRPARPWLTAIEDDHSRDLPQMRTRLARVRHPVGVPPRPRLRLHLGASGRPPRRYPPRQLRRRCLGRADPGPTSTSATPTTTPPRSTRCHHPHHQWQLPPRTATQKSRTTTQHHAQARCPAPSPRGRATAFTTPTSPSSSCRASTTRARQKQRH